MRTLRSVAHLLVMSATACGAAPSDPPRAPSEAAGPSKPEPPGRERTDARSAPSADAPSRIPAEAMREADTLYRDQLAIQGRDERFSVDRQVAALERAILLYQQFLERAGDDPLYADAVKRSRERIVDAKDTLKFLLEDYDLP